MPTPKERLTHLVELASQGEAARPELAHELVRSPARLAPDHPSAARLPFEALLEKAVREVGRETRAAIAARFARRADAPVDILNELFFAASAEMKDGIVARNAREGRAGPDLPCSVDERWLLLAARNEKLDFATAFADALALDEATAREISAVTRRQSLALACKGVHLGRATFSAMPCSATAPAPPTIPIRGWLSSTRSRRAPPRACWPSGAIIAKRSRSSSTQRRRSSAKRRYPSACTSWRSRVLANFIFGNLSLT